MSRIQTTRDLAPMSWTGFCILLCAWLVCTGWTLSIFRWLNFTGYSISLILALTLVVIFRKSCLPKFNGPPFSKLRRRFLRLPSFLYLVVFFMALIGGILYAPSNYDATTYRLPRILQWISEGGWHWIHTSHVAVNTRTAATEWISLPIILFSSSDRFLFLPNIISFAFLPGLVFGILTRLKVSPRVAVQWMWIFPSGYCFALQAGSIGNDLIGATLFLGGIFYALKARKSLAWSHFALACLGMALATGSKTSNVPLGLAWMIALLPAIPLVWRFPLRALALAPFLILTSFLPNAWLNHKYCGDWTGMKIEPVLMRGGDPLLYVSWNVPYLIIQNLTPPIFPFNQAWNNAVAERIPPDLNIRLKRNFEEDASNWSMHETMMEENGPLGLGVVSLLVMGAIGGSVAHRRGNKSLSSNKNTGLLWLVFLGAFVSILPFLVKSGLTGSGRYLAPHYLLLILPFLITPGIAVFMRSKLWKTGVLFCFLALFSTMMISAARPLWPALTVLKSINAEKSPNPLLKRAWDVYMVYRERPTAFEPICKLLPEDAINVGILSANTPEASLWKPFGSRQIHHILTTDTPQSIDDRDIGYIVAGERSMWESGFPNVEEWCSLNNATIVAKVQFTVMVRKGLDSWYLLKINPATKNESITPNNP